MAGQATVEAALAHDPEGFDVTLVGREPELPYNRVLLSRLLAGGVGEPELALRPAPWYADRGARVLTDRAVERLDLDSGRALLGDGSVLDYDLLVLATGSRPAVPPIDGLAESGAIAFRSLADVRAMLARARAGRRAIVIGGGLLGLEAARGLRERGMRVSVVEVAGRVMAAQLDGLGAGLLERALRELGIDVLTGRRVAAVIGPGPHLSETTPSARPVEVVLEDGERIPADLLVVATGIRPEIDLARAAGLEVARGVVVDDELRTSAPRVWAVGECAEHRGAVYGLWAPVLAQANAAGASLAGRPAAFHGSAPATTLKVSGVDLFCAGASEAGRDDEEVLALDSRRGLYRRLLLRDGRLRGAILLGELDDAPRLREALRSGAPVPEALLAGRAGGPGPAPSGDGLVCSCNTVSGADIRSAVTAGADSVEAVARATRATTGCGSCRQHVERLLSDLRAAREREISLAA
jgi:ferredoxin-nitrate reductase